MSLRRAIVITTVVLLVGCFFTLDPEPTRVPSATTFDSITLESGVVSLPTVVFPVPMNVIQDLIEGGTKQIIRWMMKITNSRPALKLDISASEVTLAAPEANQKSFILRRRTNQTAPTESGIQYLGQTTFRPVGYPPGNVSELFDIVTRMGATGTEKILQVVEQRSDEVYLTVTTTPEMKAVFFEKDGAAVRNLGYMSMADLTDGLTAVIVGSRATIQIGFGPNTGYWTDLLANNGITERRIRSATLSVYTTRLKETSSLTPFDPIRLNALMLARSIQKFNHGSKAECRIEMDNRYRHKAPIIRYDYSGRIHFTGPDGTEYSEDQLKQ